MLNSFDQLQKLGQDSLDATILSLGAFSKGAQAIAVETADFAKKSFENGTGTLEKLTGARSLETALEIQKGYVRSAYEDLVAQSTRFGELYSALAKETFKPFEKIVPKPFTA